MSNMIDDSLPLDPRPVGELLELELTARGWSQADFANVLDRPAQFVSEIVSGKKEITRESAAQIGAALSTSAEFWLNAQNQCLLVEQKRDVTTQAKLDDVRRRALLRSKGPIPLLTKRGFLSQGATLDKLEAEVIDLFELTSLEDEPALVAAAKRSNHGEEITLLQQTWVYCIRHQARIMPPPGRYSREGLEKLAASLPKAMHAPEDFATLPDLFAEEGVRLVFVEAFPGAKIDGCAMFIDDYAVIGLSGRGKRLDKVLFALLHEIAHILRGHVDSTVIVEDLEDKLEQQSTQERQANNDGVNWIFPRGFPHVPARIGGPWVDQASAENGIARIVLIGQLQKRRRLDWRSTLTKDAPSVADVLQTWT